MTTLVPRPPYSREELDRLYPKSLKLQQVQVLLRHGERSPVSARFQNAGLSPYWPYCNAAKRLSSVAMTSTDWSTWDKLQWRRRLETFGASDASILASGPNGEVDGICNFGELTDKGRETTLALGQRLRRLYVDQLHFMPNIIRNADMIYLRASPMPRALESVQQSFWGMYPLSARTATFPPPTIITRTPQDETLFPNEASCRRFSQLSRAFGQLAADKWNKSSEMDYLSSLLSKWMPGESKVAVDSHPRLSGIMDTINATLAHGPETRLPADFYDKKALSIIDKVGVEEWFEGYKTSHEYRKVGCGALAGDIVARMVSSVENLDDDGPFETGREDEQLRKGRGGKATVKFGMSGAHDTTLAALLCSLGAFEGQSWPPYTSHLAFELFKDARADTIPDGENSSGALHGSSDAKRPSLLRRLLPFQKSNNRPSQTSPNTTSRKPLTEMSSGETDKLKGHYVRIRYNDQPVTVPGCKAPGKHLEGDESFCTLEAFKAIVDKFTPSNWKAACMSNLDQPPIPKEVEPAGY